MRKLACSAAHLQEPRARAVETRAAGCANCNAQTGGGGSAGRACSSQHHHLGSNPTPVARGVERNTPKLPQGTGHRRSPGGASPEQQKLRHGANCTSSQTATQPSWTWRQAEQRAQPKPSRAEHSMPKLSYTASHMQYATALKQPAPRGAPTAAHKQAAVEAQGGQQPASKQQRNPVSRGVVVSRGRGAQHAKAAPPSFVAHLHAPPSLEQQRPAHRQAAAGAHGGRVPIKTSDQAAIQPATRGADPGQAKQSAACQSCPALPLNRRAPE